MTTNTFHIEFAFIVDQLCTVWVPIHPFALPFSTQFTYPKPNTTSHRMGHVALNFQRRRLHVRNWFIERLSFDFETHTPRVNWIDLWCAMHTPCKHTRSQWKMHTNIVCEMHKGDNEMRVVKYSDSVPIESFKNLIIWKKKCRCIISPQKAADFHSRFSVRLRIFQRFFFLYVTRYSSFHYSD